MKEEVNILLVFRTGGRFSMQDVILLANHLQGKSDDLKVNTFCLTDIITEIMPARNVTLLPMKYPWRGWWAKMNLFAPELEYLRPYMYIDLDTAIIKSLSFVLPTFHVQSNVIMLRDFYRHAKAASGLMWIPAQNGEIHRIWETWIKDPKKYMRKYRGDQEFIHSVCKPDLYWQDITSGVVSYKQNKKKHLIGLNGDENIVCFHGKPEIKEAAKSVKWVREYIKEGAL